MHIRRGFFEDEQGRTLILRGVNLGGSSKVPSKPNGATYLRENFYDHRNVSFIGRPFPLEEAGEHFTRLRAWGLTFLRFLITWEAIEHAGPGLYDHAYLDYVAAIVEKAQDYGIQMFIDPHQDVWSRFSGGDGAPGWTFEALGMDITRFQVTGAAITHQEHGDPFPRMIWPTNNSKLAAATLFTLFFAGNDFAPQTTLDGIPVQEYLQSHYTNAFKEVARRLKGLPAVVGYDTINEPGTGYIGIQDLSAQSHGFRVGDVPTPYQSMLLGAGYPQDVEVWEFRTRGPHQIGKRRLNSDCQRVWLEGHDCIWRQHGVWDTRSNGEPTLLRPDYFHQIGNRPVSFNQDYVKPFINHFAHAIRSADPETLIFVETNRRQPLPEWNPEDTENIVSAPHWYDGTVLFTKNFNPRIGSDLHGGNLIFGRRAIRKAYAEQIRSFQKTALENLRRAPTLIGEVGIPYDLQDKRALRTGDFSTTVKAMDRSLRAMDDALASYTIWTYTSDNTNARGDLWNDEDLSIFSRDQQQDPKDIHSGGRALQAVVRPYARATAGTPLQMEFDIQRRKFEFEFRHDTDCTAPTEFFIPDYQYPNGYRVIVSDGRYKIDLPTRTLWYYHTLEREIHWVRVVPCR